MAEDMVLLAHCSSRVRQTQNWHMMRCHLVGQRYARDLHVQHERIQ